ncbi:zinc-binding dehydrogenase [Nocardia sp. NPDC051570]|uniref:zinc-binding dehydrogenase n=1 Tax=Nocardia sp. NPDC051570 TaxID=3364324 RepID=UPI0037B20CCA
MASSESVRAAVFRGVDAPLAVERITLDPPGPTEVRVRMAAVGLCHTELHVLRGEQAVGMTPMVLGHEGAGIVEAVGDRVHDIVVGDHVALTWLPACGRCSACAKGNHHRCVESSRITAGPQLDGTYRRRDRTGAEVGGFCLVGAFAEQTVVDQASVVVVDRGLPFEVVALAACGVPGGFGAVTHAAGVRPGDSVLVIGAGGTGMSAIQAARLSGAGRIIAADVQEWKLAQAERFGATDTVVVRAPDELAHQVVELTGGTGVDYAFVCVGADDALPQAIRATAKGGTIVITGLIPSSVDRISVAPIELQRGQKTVIGSAYGSISQRVGIPEVLRHYESGRLDIAGLVSRSYRLDDIATAYEDLAAGRNLRGMLRFD